MELFSTLLDKFGFRLALVLWLAKTFLEFFYGRTKRFILEVEANTQAVNALTAKLELISKDTNLIPKMREDMNTAFLNIKEVRNKLSLGGLSKIDN